jgi:hypothetical protein
MRSSKGSPKTKLEVSLVGSLDVATMQMEIYLRIRAWEGAAEEAGISVDVIASTSQSRGSSPRMIGDRP